MVNSSDFSDRFEISVQDIGRQILASVRCQTLKSENRWLKWSMDKMMENDVFRIQALRFVDVFPALSTNRDVLGHLNEYFDIDESNLPGLLRWWLRNRGVTDPLIVGIVRNMMSLFSKYFMGGATADEAFETVSRLRQSKIGFSLDLVGESVVSEEEADQYEKHYLELIERLAPRFEGLKHEAILDYENDQPLPLLYISLKASSFYSQLNPLDLEGSYQGVAKRLRTIFAVARKNHVAVCLDMEQYDYKNLLLDCFKRLLMEPQFHDWCDVGIAVQAYLKDSNQDLEALIAWAETRKTPITIRLVRGAYWDYETMIAQQQGWPVPVWAEKWQTDKNYESCLKLLFKHHRSVRIAVATHNIRSVSLAIALANHYDLKKDQFEFQMLYGMAQPLQFVLSEQGYRLRVYVPFGDPLPGMAYLVRRLLENSSSQSFQRLDFRRKLPAEKLLAPPCSPKTKSKPSATIPKKIQELNAKPFQNEPVFRFCEEKERQLFFEILARVRNNLGFTHPMIINGQAISGLNHIESVNPARSGELVGRVVCAGIRDADQAIKGAQAAFIAWSGCGVAARASILFKAAELLRKRRLEFAALEIFEAGKTWLEADANVTEAIDFMNYYGEAAISFLNPSHRNVPGETNLLWSRPRGVGVIIPPWNFPLAILTGMLSAAIVTGNTIILKPSSQTPVIASWLVNLLMEAGLPKGVVQFLPGPGATIGEYLVQHPKVHFIAFTGSKEVGVRIIKLAAEISPGQHHVKKVIAEMGGKNAIIVDSDADLDEAVPGVLKSAFGYQGQKCSACSRVIVVGIHADFFLKRLVAATRSLNIGFPENPGVFMGPVIDAQAKQRILRAIADGKKNAERVLHTDCSHLGNGFFVGPTIFTKVPATSNLAQVEIFGPVLSVMNTNSLDDALKIANNTAFALTGGLYSRSPANIEKTKRLFEVGNLYVNRSITGALVHRQPFGGFKLSGIGAKAGNQDYLLQFLNPCTFTEKTLRRGFAPNFNSC